MRIIEFLREEILLPGDGVKDVMPGIRELLPVLQSRDDMSLGLLTGNFEEAARIKLGHFDLWDYFRCGAFGDDAADRNALVPFAVERARACGLGDFDYADVVVIGDTPSDVACARAVGARAGRGRHRHLRRRGPARDRRADRARGSERRRRVREDD